jgi:hypothetical protein
LEARRLLIGSDWTNNLSPLNVNNDPNGLVSPVDVLLIINELNRKQIQDPSSGALPTISPNSPQPPPYIDVNCDRFVTPLDALLVVNDLNGIQLELGEAYVTSAGVHGNYSPLGCGAILREGTAFTSSITTHLTVPSDAAAVSILLEGIELDVSSSEDIHDAFEVALLDSSGRTLVQPIAAGRDAFFNSTEAIEKYATSQVFVSGNRVTLSLADVLPGTQADLVFRLINNDADTGSMAAIRAVEFAASFPNGEGLKSNKLPAPVPSPSAIPADAFGSNAPFPTAESSPAPNVVTGRSPTLAASNSDKNPNYGNSEGPIDTRIDSRGTEFWIGFPDNLYEGSNRPQKLLYLTGQTATTGFVEIPGLIDPATSEAFRVEFSVNPGEVTTVPLPSDDVGDNNDPETDFDVEVELISQVQHKGIHVVTQEPVTVYGLDLAVSTSDAFLALPVSSLGTEYINLGYENTFASISSVEGTQFLVVAAEDNT